MPIVVLRFDDGDGKVKPTVQGVAFSAEGLEKTLEEGKNQYPKATFEWQITNIIHK